MQRLSLRVSALLLLFVSLCVLPTTSAFASDKDEAAKKLAALDNEWSKAAASHDADRVASYYAEDAHVYPPNEPLIVGRTAARDSWAKMLADPNVTLVWTTESYGVDGKTGYTAGSYKVTTTDNKVVETGKYLCVWQKDAQGNWKAIHDMWNTDAK